MFLESASCASSANMTVDRSLSKIPPPQEKQLQMFLEMGKLDMFRLALDGEEQVWGYGPALLCILLHYTSFLLSLLPSLLFLSLFNPSLLFSGSMDPTYSRFSSILLQSPSFFHCLRSFCSLVVLIFLCCLLVLHFFSCYSLFSHLFFFHLFYFFHGPFCQVQPKTTKGWVTWESGENWDVLRVLLIISVCG